MIYFSFISLDDEGLLNLIEDIDVTPLTYQLDFPWMREHSLKREDLSDALLLKMMKKGLVSCTRTTNI